MSIGRSSPLDKILTELIDLSHNIGGEERCLAILGEGNTSAINGDGTFWVKASGSHLATIDEKGFSRVSLKVVQSLCQVESMSDDAVAEGLKNALIDPSYRKPSVETFLHGLCYLETGVTWVAHTHPISVNSILCSRLGASPFLNHLFPDGIVVCGLSPAVVPYIDPGFPLALAFRNELRRYMDKNGLPPKVFLMVNHGLVALGSSAREVFNITLMADKWAKVILGTFALGGPNYLSDEEAMRINNRQDEAYRRSQLGVA